MYTVELSREADRFFARCDKPTAAKLARCFAALERDPRSGNNIKPLKGSLAGSYRYRVGNHRVVYTIDDAIVKVFIITIAHRRDVYE
jgi:mRNA interferase RelE/StbE